MNSSLFKGEIRDTYSHGHREKRVQQTMSHQGLSPVCIEIGIAAVVEICWYYYHILCLSNVLSENHKYRNIKMNQKHDVLMFIVHLLTWSDSSTCTHKTSTFAFRCL